MKIVFDSSSEIYSATFVQYSSSGSQLASTPISGNGTVTVQTQTANIRIIVSSSVNTSTSKWKSSNSGTWYILSNDNKILPTGSNWPAKITLILKSSSGGGGGSTTTTYYRCYDVTNDTYINSLTSTTESSFLRPTWSGYTYIGYGQGASLTVAKNQYANDNYSTSTVCTPSYSYVVFFYSNNSGGGGGGSTTTTYSWDCYDLTNDRYISGYEHTGVTNSSITRPSISGYTYQGYVYYDSWSKCVKAGKSGNYDSTEITCSSHNSLNPYIVFFYTKNTTSYSSWQAPVYQSRNNWSPSKITDSSSITGNITINLYSASYFRVIVPCGGTLTFQTTTGTTNYDPYGYITTVQPSKAADGTERTNSFTQSSDTVSNDDGGGTFDCLVTVTKKSLSSVTYYIALNVGFSSSGSISIPYKLTFTPYIGQMKFYNNDGSTLINTLTNYGSNTAYMPSASAPTNFVFQGWSTNINGTSAVYQSGAYITATNTTINFYGVWYFSLSFDSNGGNSAPSSIVYRNNSTQTFTMPTTTKLSTWGSSSDQIRYKINRYEPDNSTILIEDYVYYRPKTIYTLSSWNTNNTGTGSNFTPNASYSTSNANLPMSNGSGKLYAKWTSNTNNDCYLSATIEISPNEQYLEGYEFLGYSTIKNSSVAEYEVNGNYLFNRASNINLYPVFKRKFYFGKNKEWKECKLYYGINNEWKEITINKGMGGKWV